MMLHNMWIHRNDALYQQQKSQTSTKAKEKIDKDIETELMIGKEGLRKRDARLVTFDRRIKSGHPGIQQRWLSGVDILQK